MRALEIAMETPWAMLPANLEQLLEIAAREHNVTPEALEAYRAQHLRRSERAGARDGVAVLQVNGPLFKGANLFTEVSGATSYERLRRDLQTALDDNQIGAVLLSIDSPGGEAFGCDELAKAIYAARGKKPIHAHIGGLGCSGAYWIAAACEKITVSDLANVGSIGVVLGVSDRKKADEARGVTTMEFVSSQSPGKRPNIDTDEGRSQIQKLVDDMGDVFVSAVAKYRGVSVDKVLNDFAKGGVEVGEKARRAGMVDAVGQFEDVLQSLASRTARQAGSQKPAAPALGGLGTGALVEAQQLPAVDFLPPTEPLPSAPVVAPPTLAEFRARIAGFADIEGQDVAPALYEALRDYTTISAESAQVVMAAVKEDFARFGASDEERYLIRAMRAGTLGTESWTVGADGRVKTPVYGKSFP